MGIKNGKPCKRCGEFDYNKRGDCRQCKKRSANAWYEKNKAAVSEYHAKRDNSGYMRNWKKNNRGKSVSYRQKRRAKKTKAGGSFTAKEFSDLCAHYSNICLRCGRDSVKLTADHIVPISKGGTSNIDNIQPLCLSCNSRKGAKTKDYRGGNVLTRWVQRELF